MKAGILNSPFWLNVYASAPDYRTSGRFGAWIVQEQRDGGWFEVSGPFWRWRTAARVEGDLRREALNAAQRATLAMSGLTEVPR